MAACDLFGVFNRNMKPVRVEDVAKQLVDGMIQAVPKAGATTASNAVGAGATTAGASAPNVPADLAVICLFALAVFAIGLACSRAKQKKEA